MDFPVSELCSSTANPPSFFSSASASASNFNALPLKQSWASSSTNHHTDDTWKKIESVDRKEEKRATGSSYNSVFGIVPSKFDMEDFMIPFDYYKHIHQSRYTILCLESNPN